MSFTARQKETIRKIAILATSPAIEIILMKCLSRHLIRRSTALALTARSKLPRRNASPMNTSALK